jgi:hypothetical protein
MLPYLMAPFNSVAKLRTRSDLSNLTAYFADERLVQRARQTSDFEWFAQPDGEDSIDDAFPALDYDRPIHETQHVFSKNEVMK